MLNWYNMIWKINRTNLRFLSQNNDTNIFKIKHFTNNNGIYEEIFIGSLFSKRIYKKELSGKSFSELFRKNYNMYIDEKKALFYNSVYFDLTEEKKCWNKIVNSYIQKVLK